MADMPAAAKKAWEVRYAKYGKTGIGDVKKDRSVAAKKAWEERFRKYGPKGRRKDLTKDEIVIMLRNIASQLNRIRRSLEG